MPHIELPWHEMDPRDRPPPDAEVVERFALRGFKHHRGESERLKGLAIREVEHLLINRVGMWTTGWSHGRADGGPNHVWQGLKSVSADPKESAKTVVAAVEDWNDWLGALAPQFDAFAEATKGIDELDAVQRAVTVMLPIVLERTGADESWYRTFAVVTSWCLQAAGRSTDSLTEIIERTVEGRFSSWAAPEPEVVQEVSDDLALEIAGRDQPPFVEDALEAWWKVRSGSPWVAPVPRDIRGAEGDAHRRYIELRDRPRSATRADAMIRALVRARWGAEKGLALDTALLREWQELAMYPSKDVSFRNGEAFAKDRGERYGRPKDLEKRLAEALKAASDFSTSPIARGARIYLDLCFLHPFKDGNARAARLALDYVLTQAGLALLDGPPIFAIPRWAHDEQEPWRFQRTLAACVGRA
ncbi:MAG: Fic family protein [Sandaracinaceae bacterium]